jgi:predicted dehydrogenase
LLADKSIDAIGIYTPDPLHARHIKQTLEAGKHAICTKPLIDNLADAAMLIDAQARERETRLRRAELAVLRVDDAAAARLRSGQARRAVLRRGGVQRGQPVVPQKSWAEGGGLKWLYGGLSHPVDLVRWYMPDVEEVMGFGLLTENGRKLGLVHEDSMHFVFKTASGKIARVTGCYSSPPAAHVRDSHMSCILRGEGGASVADYYDLRYTTHFKGEGCVQYDMEHRAPYYFRFGGRGHHAGEYQNYIEYFARCVAVRRNSEADLTGGDRHRRADDGDGAEPGIADAGARAGRFGGRRTRRFDVGLSGHFHRRGAENAEEDQNSNFRFCISSASSAPLR